MATQCNDIHSLLPTYLDGELAPHDQLSFDHHVADCAECREQVRAGGAYQARLRELLAPPAAPEHLAARVREALDQDERRARAARWRERRAWALPGAASLAAAAALVLLVTDGSGLPGGAPSISDGDAPHARRPNGPEMPVGLSPFGPARRSSAARPSWLAVEARFEVHLSDSRVYQIQLDMVNCRTVDLAGFRRYTAAGAELWVSQAEVNTVIHSTGSDGDTCMVFASDMELEQLIPQIVRSGLVSP
jgi:hypothetical protein